MKSASDYLELARECFEQAEACDDPACKEALLDVAKLYNQAALTIDAAEGTLLQEATLSSQRMDDPNLAMHAFSRDLS